MAGLRPHKYDFRESSVMGSATQVSEPRVRGEVGLQGAGKGQAEGLVVYEAGWM